MKTSAIRALRDKLSEGKAVYGIWATLESGSVSEMAVAAGLDWVVIDAEHGHLDWHDIVEHIRATVRSNTVALVRIPEFNGGTIKRVLDIGADGVVIPWIETAGQLREAVKWATYPPAGRRGIGAERATAWGKCFAEHVAEADDHVMVVPMIETVTAGRNIRELASVESVELYFFGPADYASSAGQPGKWDPPGIAEQMLEAKDAVLAAGKRCGVIAIGEDDLRRRLDQGFRAIGLGADAGLMLRGMGTMLAAAGRELRLSASLTPVPIESRPLPRPPESMRPDRPEVMNEPGSGPEIEISPGVVFDCLVGSHNSARNLTTGIVTFQGGAELPYHTHEFGESITLLSGRAAVEVEGREYEISPLDNVTIPRDIAHAVRNVSESQPCVLHVAMASATPTRTLVTQTFPWRQMGEHDRPPGGTERITRAAGATRYSTGPNTSFIDYFNAELMPGIEMSGGYGLFDHGGRLPAHIHDFDESITIIDGTATCVVEGRRYTQSDNSTALQPRGRVHYFINENHRPMAMIWVYAGPMPQRIVVDERCATLEGDPWK